MGCCRMRESHSLRLSYFDTEDEDIVRTGTHWRKLGLLTALAIGAYTAVSQIDVALLFHPERVADWLHLVGLFEPILFM